MALATSDKRRNHVQEFPAGHLFARGQSTIPGLSAGHGASFLAILLMPLVIVDFPLSLAVDLVVLPATIPAELSRGDDDSEEEASPDQP